MIPLEGCDNVLGLLPVTPNLKNSELCSCSCFQEPVPLPPRAISTSADDGEQPTGGSVALGKNALALGTNSSGAATIVGLRFPVLGIAQGSIIDSASIQFTAAQSSTATAADLQITGEDIDDAEPFATPDFTTTSRPRTMAVDWPIAAAWNNGEAAGAEKTADLTPILQAIVNRTGWKATNAIAIFFAGTGARSAVSYDGSHTKAATLTVVYEEPRSSQNIPVCLGADLNQDLNSSLTAAPTPDQLEGDCNGRVQTTITGLATGCKYSNHCECHYVSDTLAYKDTCSMACTQNDLASDCSNLDPTNGNVLATNAPGDMPVCSAHSPLAAAIFGRRSTCEVSGTAKIHTSDDDETTGAHGTIELVGTPCPGQPCAVRVSHRFKLDDVTFGNLFESATFSDLKALGDTVPGGEAQLQADGSGVLAIGSTSNSCRGQRDNGEVMALVGPNQDVVNVGVDWQPGAAIGCTLSGALVGSLNPEEKRCENPPNALCTSDPSVCGSDASCTGASNGDGTSVCQCQAITSTGTTVSLSVQGALINQPPTASAGADQVVECNLTNAARFTLDGTGTQDPDNNLTSFRWFRGSRIGDEVGFQPQVAVTQALGGPVPYVLRVIDAFGQADEDTSMATVVDTTPPTIACNAPATITPTQAPISFTATASDICDPSPSATVTGFSCYKVGKNGVVSKVESCVVSFKSNKITITNSGGIGDNVQWTVSARDHSGNTSTATCVVRVVQR